MGSGLALLLWASQNGLRVRAFGPPRLRGKICYTRPEAPLLASLRSVAHAIAHAEPKGRRIMLVIIVTIKSYWNGYCSSP